jgi:hypothetical protein
MTKESVTPSALRPDERVAKGGVHSPIALGNPGVMPPARPPEVRAGTR